MTVASATPGISDYMDLVAKVQIDRILLRECSCRRFWEEAALPKSPKIKFTFRPSLLGIGDKGFAALTRFTVTAEQEGLAQDIDPGVFRLTVGFVIHYRVEGEWFSRIPEKRRKSLVTKFIRRNVPINAWPYGREIIASLTTRMDFPSVVLPVLRSLPRKNR